MGWLHAGIDPLVEEVHQEVGSDDAGSAEENHAEDHRDIEIEDALDGQRANPRQGEHVLHKDDTAEQEGVHV